MRAVQFKHVGDPASVLVLGDIPTPKPGRGEVLVKMIASPINPSDLMYITGKYGLKPTLPAIPGFEGVGVVEASGGGLLGWFRKGKRVAVISDRHGNWCDYTITTARQVVPVPDDLSDEQAATFFVNPFTAVVLIKHILKLPRGAWLMQTAAAGALGRMIIRLGKEYGYRTINIVRRSEQVEPLKVIGANEVWVEGEQPIAELVAKRLAGEEVKYAIDPVGGSLASEVLASLAPGGRLILYGSLSGETLSVDPRQLLLSGKIVEGFWLALWMKQQRVLSLLKMIREVRRLKTKGILATDFGERYPLERFHEAVVEAMKPGKTGKVLLTM